MSDDTGRSGRRRGRKRAAAETPVEPTLPPYPLDAMTGLATRSVLHDWLHEATTVSRANSSRVVLAFVDLHSLRDVNDSLGPDAGDAVLQQASARLGHLGWEATRPLRWGSAELGVVVGGVDEVDAPEQIARALLETVAAPYQLGRETLQVSCHLGMALSSDHYANVGELVRDAHQALVAARERGPGAYVIHDESKRGRYHTRIDEARLQTALDHDEFLLHYQPIVRVGETQLIGVEALLRWQAPGATNTGVLFPHDFLPLLEKSGLIVPVGRWVIETACAQAMDWSTRHPHSPDLLVACNVGAHQLAMPGFEDTVLHALEVTGLDPLRLCLDITEEAVAYNGSSTWVALRRLKDAGVRLGLGDFGTGVSSVATLREMRFDLVRIDRRFVEELAMSAEDQAIVRNIANLAHDLGMYAVIEGIESADQAALLPDLGVDLAQGFYFGRPDDIVHIDDILDPPDPDGPYGTVYDNFPPEGLAPPDPEANPRYPPGSLPPAPPPAPPPPPAADED